MRLNVILKNSFFYTTAGVLQGFIGFLLLPVYTKYLTPSDYGVLALVTSFIGIFSSIISLQIDSGIPRFVVKFLNDENRAKAYFTSIFILLLSILVFSCMAINVFGEKIVKVIFLNKGNIVYAPLFQLGTWILLPTLLINATRSLLQTLEYGFKSFLIAIIQMVINVVFGLFLVVSIKAGPTGILWAQLIGAICGLLLSLWFVRDWFQLVLPKVPLQDIKDSLRYSLPIIPHMLSIYIFMQSNRLILQRYVPLADIGIYSIADTFAFILLIIINAVNLAYSPVFLKLAQSDKSRAQEETKKFIGIWWIGIMTMFLGYLILSDNLIRLMTRPAFYPAIPLIPILAFGYIFRGLYCFSANSIFYIEKTKFIPVITVTAAIVNVTGNIIFIPKFGIFAAAWVTVFSYLFTFILAYYFSLKVFPIRFPWRNMVNVALICFLVYVTVKGFNKLFLSHSWINLCVNFTVVILFALICIVVICRIKDFNSLKSLIIRLRGV